jgi:hypothetical protein
MALQLSDSLQFASRDPEEYRLYFGMPKSEYYMLDKRYRRNEALAYCKSEGCDWWSLARDWNSWNAIKHDAWKPIFKRGRDYWHPTIFEPEQRKMYDALPDKITIYRGCHTGMRHGRRRLSWTLDESCAHWFADTGIRGWKPGGAPVVYRGVIKKKDVALVFCDRNESEIVPFDAKAIRNIEEFALDPALAADRTAKSKAAYEAWLALTKAKAA